jgi:hypothetical protein
MIVCPVCEHAQAQGAECEVCGKRLVVGLSPADRAIPPVDGLEPTRFVSSDVLDERLPDLEPTLRGADAPFREERTPDLEATAAAPVDVDSPPVPDLERTDLVVPDDGPTLLPEVVTCRYCRTPAAPGERICGRCGMRLPIASALSPKAAAEELRVCTCGTAVRPDASLCPACGARLH